MKKILVLNGSPRKGGNTTALVEEVVSVAKENNVEVKTYQLNDMNIKGCQGCNACKKQGRCVLKDDMQELYDEIQSASGIVFATPVYMWQMTSQLKTAMDRLYPFLNPDYSSALIPGKKVLLAVTQGQPDTSMFHQYFEQVGKTLSFLGFGSYEILIAGGAGRVENILQPEVVSEANKMGEWLIN